MITQNGCKDSLIVMENVFFQYEELVIGDR